MRRSDTVWLFAVSSTLLLVLLPVWSEDLYRTNLIR